jgi:ribosomal protein L3 glutamine methyltransferase
MRSTSRRRRFPVAERNVAEYGLHDRVEIDPLGRVRRKLQGRRYDLIICQPALCQRRLDAPRCPPEYLHEPVMALGSAAKDGLDFTRIILRDARRHLTEDGLLVVEIGHNRAELEASFPALPFTWLDTTAGDEFVFLLSREELP